MKSIKHKLIFDKLPIPCLLLQPESPSSFRIVDMNQPYAEITGIDKTMLIGCLTEKAFPGNPDLNISGKAIIRNSLKKVLESGKTDHAGVIRFDLRNKNSAVFEERYWEVENSPIANSNGDIEYILHIVKDVTAEVISKSNEQKVQEDLYRKQQQYQHFIDKNPDALYSMDLNGKFISANQGLSDLTGVPLERLLTMDFRTFCTPQDKEKVEKHFQRAVQGESLQFEASFLLANKKTKILELYLAPIRSGHKITGVYGIAKDRTHLRETEKIIVEKKRFLEVNAAFVNSLIENSLEEQSMIKTFGLIGEAIDLDRMYYFGAHTDPKTNEVLISLKLEWCSEFAAPQKDNPKMQNMPARQVEQIMGPSSNHTPFMANFSDLPTSDLKNLFIDLDIKAMLLFPIFLQEKLYGFIGFDDCRRERTWSQDEITFLQSLTHHFINLLEKRTAKLAVKEKEEELRGSEKKFKALVQEGSDLIAILDKQGNITFTSGTATSALGITPPEFIGKKVFDFIHPEDRPKVKSEFEELKTKKQVKTQPFRFKNKAGNWRWIEASATDLLDDPAVGGIVINSRDITTIIEQAREIEHINKRYILAATATRDLIYDWDLETDKIVRFHKGSKEMHGHPTSKLDNRQFWHNHIHPDDLENLNKTLKRTLSDTPKSSVRTEYRFRRADGTYAHLIDRGHIIRNSEGKAIRIIGATSDISEITAQKEALEEANTRFKLAMKATNEIIWDWDISTDTVDRSKIFRRLYGYESGANSSMTNFWLPKIVQNDRKRVMNSLKAALENEEQNEWKQEYSFIKSDGNTAVVMDRGYIIRDKKGNPTRMVGAVLDVTASRRLIKEIKKQNEGLKEIAWTQSHIVRAPLARLKGLVDLLRMQGLEEVDQEEILKNIKLSADELDNILRGIVTKTEKIEIDHDPPENF